MIDRLYARLKAGESIHVRALRVGTEFIIHPAYSRLMPTIVLGYRIEHNGKKKRKAPLLDRDTINDWANQLEEVVEPARTSNVCGHLVKSDVDRHCGCLA